MVYQLKKLYTIEPKRLFTFGCSFTKYQWMTWANLLGYELGNIYNTEFYNLGQAGSGNTYIANMVSQTDQCYKFNENDLVIICWSGVTREDRYKYNRWWTHGNAYNISKSGSIFTQKLYNSIADDCHFLMRDLANIKLVNDLLSNKTQYHFLSMKDIGQYELKIRKDNHIKLLKNYSDIISKIYPSFTRVLWKNDIEIKNKRNSKLNHKYYCDTHPSPYEHYLYLKSIFDYKFSDDTINNVKSYEYKYNQLIKQFYTDINEVIHPADFPETKKKKMYDGYNKLLLKKSLPINKDIIYE